MHSTNNDSVMIHQTKDEHYVHCLTIERCVRKEEKQCARARTKGTEIVLDWTL
jgi:hypothetical protein